MAAALSVPLVQGDETCNSPYIAKLIKGQEDYVYVWTLGVEGLGDGSDKLVTDRRRTRSRRATARSCTRSRSARAARRTTWASPTTAATSGPAASPSNRIYVFDIATDPAKPKLVQDDRATWATKTGYLGPHTYYALPGRMLVQAPLERQGQGRRHRHGGLQQQGRVHRLATPMPASGGGDGYGYDLAVNPKKNVLLTSSFTGYANYMRPLGELIKDGEAMKKLRQHHGRVGPEGDEADEGARGPGRAARDPLVAQSRATTGRSPPRRSPRSSGWSSRTPRANGRRRRSAPSAIRRRSRCRWTSASPRDGKGLWVNTFMDGKTRYFDLSNPEAPKQTYEKVTGKQVNMISQSWDGKRVYITSSLLANWDKGGADNEQFLRGFAWDGKELTQMFEVDFTKEKLGRAHHMKLGLQGRCAAAAGG